MRRVIAALFIAALTGGTAAEPERVELPGLPNVYRVSPKLLSGGSPEGDAGFASLAKLGVKTIISVDGARPDAKRARRHGLRYVHLPIGYDRVTQEQALRLARAVRDLPGPVYLHCHHGKHRSPAAAAAVLVCLDATCSVEQAVNVMKAAGTSPHYLGLYATPGKLRRPTRDELDRVPGEFTEAANVPALAARMVDIEHRWDALTAVREAGWRSPQEHPDLDPPHEALQLREHYREAGRLAEAKKHGQPFLKLLASAEADARGLEAALQPGRVDASAADRFYQRSAAACTQCHRKYRDVPTAP